MRDKRNLAAIYVSAYALLFLITCIIFNTVLNVFVFTLISVLIVNLITKLLKILKLKTKSAIIVGLVIYFFLIIYGIILIIPAATEQFGSFVSTINYVFENQSWKTYLEKNPELLSGVNNLMKWLQPKLNDLTNYMLDNIAKGTPSFFVTIFYSILLTIYTLLYSSWLKKSLPNLFPKKIRPQIEKFFEKVYSALSSFVDVVIINAVITAVAFYLLSSFYFKDTAVILSFWAGITNLIPIVGVFFEYIPVFLFSLTLGLKGFIIVNIFVIAIHLGLFVIFVNVMKMHLNLNPVLMIISIIIVNQIFGLVGTFFAVPLLIFIVAYWDEFVKPKFET
ncbi:membrane protein [Thermosipho sp. 1063]|uniref:AI-2E family transporter n=1 Tax=unclassified Thermosipho (in: thermotogales) TaxID=2676525 RepID=UPI0009493DF2|nr:MULTISPECIES: AI-2E family transporter [unclassified Thermosipho (in: thermotogales)]ANQ53817.1 membrane protein [Thermosipho sp. 1070]APT72264.1 membrane protein [Thermosipho sp. 1063]